MDGQGRVLEQGIEGTTLHGWIGEADEGVGGQHGIGQEDRPDQALHRHRHGLEIPRQIPPPAGEHSTESREGEVPEQHGPLVAAPGGGDPVQKRFFRVRVGRNIGHREVGRDEGMSQGREGQGQGTEGGQGRTLPRPHQKAGPPVPADAGQQHQGQGQHQGEDQGEGAELGDHGAYRPGAPSPRHSPWAFRDSLTCLGM